MFRRGPLRRSLRRTAPIGEAGRLALRQANQLKEAGNYSQAAEIFERVAQRMENRLRPNRAAFLYLQAGHCRLLAAQPDSALRLAKKGLSILAQVQHWRAYTQGADLMIQETNRLGYATQAAELQAWLKQTAPVQPERLPNIGTTQLAQRPTDRLPAKCPFCGATLRSDMAEWIDEASSECPYCGSTIQVE
jgi:tetratricopeptide (TPR) repeat protein